MESMTTRCAVDAPDLPGHASASTVVASLESTADGLAATYGNAAYVGYSMGGRIALQIAMRHPHLVSHLVLCSTTAGIDDPDDRESRRESDARLAAHIREVGVDTFLLEWTAQPMFARLRRTSLDHEVRSANTADGLARSLETMGTGQQEPCWDRLDQLHMPVLIVTGTNDEKFTDLGRRLARSIGDNAVHVEVPDAGHAVPFERPAEFASLLSAFLR